MSGVVDFDGGLGTWVIPEWAIFTGEDPSTCRSCSAPILWVKSTRSGSRAPIDPDGTSHFATCPQADQWRKPRSRVAPHRSPGLPSGS